MIAFMNKLKEGLFHSSEFNDYLPPTLKIFKHRKAIREALSESCATGKVVGVYSPVLGDGMFLTCVDQISVHERDEIVVLKPYDMNGVLLVRTDLSIAEIKSVCPFASFYINPLSLNRTLHA
jgi:hypothetical protein